MTLQSSSEPPGKKAERQVSSLIMYIFLSRRLSCSDTANAIFSAVVSLDRKLNELDDKLTEVTGGNRTEDEENDNIDYTGGDANDVLYNNEVEQIDSDLSPPDFRDLSETAMNAGKNAASFLVGISEKVAATSMRMHQTGRPPFVLNAVEDDDDEYVEEEGYTDEDDEEELGWSESEEDDEVDFTNDQSQLPLESLDVVKMRESLKNAEEERNQCMQLVEDRNQEICRLKLALSQHDSCAASFDTDLLNLNDLKREVMWLRKVIAVSQQKESPTELKAILSEMREVSKDRSMTVLERKIRSTKESFFKEDKLKQKTLNERIEVFEAKNFRLQNEISECRDRLTQLKLEQLDLREQKRNDQAQMRNSPSSSMSSGVLIE